MVSSRTKRTAPGPVAFRRRLSIDCDGVPRRLGDMLDDWQRADFTALDNGWRRAAGVPVGSGQATCSRGYLERPRGHSKTNDLAVMSLWALLFSPRRLRGVAAAASKDQARLLRDAMASLVSLNPWLGLAVDVAKYHVTNPITKSVIEIISADVSTSWGLTPDFIVVDEVCHWPVSGHELWVSLISAAAKRANCMFVVISNAGTGLGSSWQWHTREACRVDENWYFRSLDGPQASWITADRLDEQRRMLPQPAFDRLWLNRWTSGSGDALAEEDVAGAVTLEAQFPSHVPGHVYATGLDLATRKDFAAMVTVAKCVTTNRIKLCNVRLWRPPVGGRIDLTSVERAVKAEHEKYGLGMVAVDVWQAALMAQQLRAAGVPVSEVTFSSKSLQFMASLLLDRFTNRTIELFDCEPLLADLRDLRVIERPTGGFRLESPRSSSGGHGDLATGLILSLMGTELIRSAREPMEIITPWDQSEFARH